MEGKGEQGSFVWEAAQQGGGSKDYRTKKQKGEGTRKIEADGLEREKENWAKERNRVLRRQEPKKKEKGGKSEVDGETRKTEKEAAAEIWNLEEEFRAE